VKKVVIVERCKSGVVDVPDPKPKEDWALVKIHAAPMCTEYKQFKAGKKTEFLGHEAAGEVEAVDQPCRVDPGDRVVVMPLYACGKCSLCLAGEYIHCQQTYDFEAFTGSREGQGSFAQYVLKPSWLLIKIPADMSYEHASMACCGLGPSFGACELMGVDAYDTVLITGMGPVGLGAVINARYRGARVIAAEPHPYRAELAKKIGADIVIDASGKDGLEQIIDFTDGVGVDKSIDCTGVPEAHRLCMDATRRKGHVAFVGEGGNTTVCVSDDMIRKGLTLHGVWHYNLSAVPKMMKTIAETRDLLDMLITHVFSMSRVQEAFELQLTGNCGKIILQPWL